jgi:hypothetical protein
VSEDRDGYLCWGVFVVDDRSNNSKRQHQAIEKGGCRNQAIMIDDV